MIRVMIICEGATEEFFVSKMLAPHFISYNVSVSPINLDRGFNYDSLKNNIVKTLNSDKNAHVTTLVDLYGISNDYPGYKANATKEALQKVLMIEEAVQQDVLTHKHLYNRQFFCHFQLHEFEALLFSDPNSLEESLIIDHPEIPKGSFAKILSDFPSPEYINDSVHTKPSQRIINLAPSYDKVSEGILIAEIIGLEKMRNACPHFDLWIKKIENLT